MIEQIVDCENCEKDHKCCTNFGVTLTQEEVGKFEHKKIVPLTENSFILGYAFVLMKKEDGSCMYQNNDTKLCTIHKRRPSACKKFSCIGRM